MNTKILAGIVVVLSFVAGFGLGGFLSPPQVVPHDVFVTSVVAPTYAQTEQIPLSINQGVDVSRIPTPDELQGFEDRLQEVTALVQAMKGSTVENTVISASAVDQNYSQLEDMVTSLSNDYWQATHTQP